MGYSEANVKSQIDAVIYLLEMQRQFGNANTPNVITQTDAVYAALQGITSPTVARAVGEFRRANSNIISPIQGRKLLDTLLLDMAIVKSYSETDPPAILRRLLHDYSQGTPVTIKDRNTTFGSVTAGGSNVGSGTIYRLTKDPYDYPIQAVSPEVKTFTCIVDENGGANAGQEKFNYHGVDREPDNLLVLGSGINIDTPRAKDGGDSTGYLTNPSFSGTETASTFNGWTITTITAAHDTTNYFRTYSGESTAGSIKLTGNGTVSQPLTTARGKFKADVPYFLAFRWNRSVGSAPANTTIDVDLGAQSSIIAITMTGAESGWQTAVATMDKKLYYQNWAGTSAALTFTIGSQATGYTLIDDVQLWPMTRIDGIWYAILGGATPFIDGSEFDGDYFTFDDSVMTGAVKAYWLWQLYGVDCQLPNAASPTWADPLVWA